MRPLTFILLLGFVTAVQAFDTAREQRWAEALREQVDAGAPVELAGPDGPFLALYTPETGAETLGAVLLLHDVAAHPDWRGVIHTLRTGLPEHGWTTLALQLPLPDPEAGIARYAELLDAAGPRIEAGLAHLKGEGYHNIVLLGHGLGALMAAEFITAGDDPALVGLALVGMPSHPEVDERLEATAPLEKLRRPTLDIFGSRDERAVTATARDRLTAARKALDLLVANTWPQSGLRYTEERAEQPAYRQIEIDGADHNFQGQTDVLLTRVRGWLKRNVAGLKINVQSNGGSSSSP